MSNDGLLVVDLIVAGALIMDVLYEFLRRDDLGQMKNNDADERNRSLMQEVRRHDDDSWR